MTNFMLLLLTLIMAFIAACSNPFEDKDKCPCTVNLQELQPNGQYERKSFYLSTLRDPRKMIGSVIRVTLNPRFSRDGEVSEITPEAQYLVNADKQLVPTSTRSDELFTIYKIMEDLYKFDQATGVDQILNYPRILSIQERAKKANEKDDAFYSPLYDRIVFLSYTGKKAPLAHNTGVIAHEHFHAIFNKIVNPISETIDDMNYDAKLNLHDESPTLAEQFSVSSMEVETRAGFNYLILKSLDEGLADFWTNLQTDMSNSYVVSYMPEDQMEARAVQATIYPMDALPVLKADLDFSAYEREKKLTDRPVRKKVYGNAVKYSNFIKTLSEKMYPSHAEASALSHQERKVAIAQWIIASLKKLSVVVQEKGQTQYLTQAEILESFIPDNKEALGDICVSMKAFLTYQDSKVSSCTGL